MENKPFPYYGMNSWPFLNMHGDTPIKCEDSLLNAFKVESDLMPTQTYGSRRDSMFYSRSDGFDMVDKKPLIDKVEWNTASSSYSTKQFTALQSNRTKHKNKLNVLIDTTNLIWYKSLKSQASVNDFFKQEANLFTTKKPRVRRNNCVFGCNPETSAKVNKKHVDINKTRRKRMRNGNKELVRSKSSLNRFSMNLNVNEVKVALDPSKVRELCAAKGLLALSTPPTVAPTDDVNSLKEVKVVIDSSNVLKHCTTKSMWMKNVNRTLESRSVKKCAPKDSEQLPLLKSPVCGSNNLNNLRKNLKVAVETNSVLEQYVAKGIGQYTFPSLPLSGLSSNMNSMNDMKVVVDSSNVLPLLTTCSVCGDKCSVGGLMAHLRSHVEPYACSFCPERFQRNSQLRGHMQIHKNMKPLVCSVCSKSFKRNAELKKHLRVHENEKRFVCLHCNKRFRQSSHLDVHLPTHFPGEKPFDCHICGKKFAQSNNRNRHLKTCLKRNVADKCVV